MIVTWVETATAEVAMLNTADEVAPGSTGTETGTVAIVVSEELKVTVTPEGPAGPSRFTLFAVIVTPPATVAGHWRWLSQPPLHLWG